MDRVQAAAANIADWHDTSLRALGRTTRRTDALWSCEEGPGIIFHMAIPLGARDSIDQQRAEIEAFAERRAGQNIVVPDFWDGLNLGERGFIPSPYGAVSDLFWRPPAAQADPLELPKGFPEGLEVEEVSDRDGLREFERVSMRGFGSEDRLETVGTFGVHAPGVLEDPRMHVYIGHVDGIPVTAAMAYVSDQVVGIYGVSTPQEHRRRGYGEAITRAAINAAPELPAWLDPSEMATPMYRRLGFEQIAQYTAWLRPGVE
jgi:GNAT superfamily N-acetyltransferase